MMSPNQLNTKKLQGKLPRLHIYNREREREGDKQDTERQREWGWRERERVCERHHNAG